MMKFLSSGEDFNAAIGAALKKCSLFALTVTPNIVEENNHVMAVEHPEARKANKPILPMVLPPTDPEVLYRCFQCLPLCTDAHAGAFCAAC